MSRTLVAGVDSSTQSCKVVVRDAATGELVREGSARHPDGTEIDPEIWWQALQQAVQAAGGLADVAALAVGAQQHGMVCLDDRGRVVRPALLWNDTRSAGAAEALIAELDGGAGAWARATGSVPVASFTVTKLRWLAEHEPGAATRTAAVCLPHDWLTWRLNGNGPVGSGSAALDRLATDRGDASGTGYWSPAAGAYRRDLLGLALGVPDDATPLLPGVLGPADSPGVVAPGVVAPGVVAPGVVAAVTSPGGAVLGPGTGDNAGAALGLGAGTGDVIVSIGTSGVVSGISAVSTADPTGIVAGFADAAGAFLPLACTLNAARVLSSTAALLGVGLDELSRLALAAPAGAGGLVLVPYLEGERTPNRPLATGSLHGLTGASMTAAHLARAAVEGLLCSLADGVDALVAHGLTARRVLLIGGGARSAAVQELAAGIVGLPVVVPPPGEYVADGAARQAAWTLGGATNPPGWATAAAPTREADPQPSVRHRYAEARELTLTRPAADR